MDDQSGKGDELAETEFDRVQWHDVHIHAIAAMPDSYALCFDIDYIVEWLCPPSGRGQAKFRVAPATLVFDDVSDVSIAVISQQGLLEISEVQRSTITPPSANDVVIWNWVVKCQEGNITFNASGFRLILRQPPMLSNVQRLDADHRGLPSFLPIK
jgi:hypothetical protein